MRNGADDTSPKAVDIYPTYNEVCSTWYVWPPFELLFIAHYCPGGAINDKRGIPRNDSNELHIALRSRSIPDEPQRFVLYDLFKWVEIEVEVWIVIIRGRVEA